MAGERTIRRARARTTAAILALLPLLGFGAGADPGTSAVSGTIRYTGAPPAPTTVDLGGHPYCEEARRGDPLTTAPVRVDEDGGLRDVVVYVREGVAGERAAAAGDPVVLDQESCVYRPPVVAVRVGQPLVIRNSDATMHNVRVVAEHNRSFNIGQPIRGIEARRTFREAEVGIRVACDIHGWMHAAIAVFDHPWYAVTDESGDFRLPDLPPGEYVVEAWHRTLGSRARTVRIGAEGAPTVVLDFAGND